MTLPVAILAGGLATRLRPITETIPKALLSVAGEPFIAHQLRRLKVSGATRVVLLVGYLGEQIKAFVGDGAAFGLQVDYHFDGDVLLGTGGALRAALPLLGDAFFVTYGDSYLDMRLAAAELAWRCSGAPALMAVFRNDGQWDTSNVEFENGRILRYDKTDRTDRMRHIDYGFGIVTAATLLLQPEAQAFDLATVYRDLSLDGELAGFEVHVRFYEIGSQDGLKETDDYIRGNGMTVTNYTKQYYEEVLAVASGIDQQQVDAMVDVLVDVRAKGGRLFILGVGGSAGNAGHAVNDFRKLCGIESYAPTDNVSELTARTNDEGWATVFAGFLRVSRIRAEDAVLVFSVGGGNAEKNISPNIVEALKLAKSVGARVIGVVGRDGGYTKVVADACVVVPTVNHATVTPHTEAFHAVVWHGMVTHPKLLTNEMKWESVR
ncbi:sugar phosphate nucleotidyltransferase [Bosea sp. NBC_00550]|uniref:sugar phosphate nucleotidyltransferase n=1 Tax=Bosea sp. NBC_00550 TaxID=2969621 RepID=UPI002230809B|nr:sugar phosphate nucleotidyltransferase [Bosea sp. NBC_00550]UZF91289.1 SIS domain-containing protein [Bosea sp. NBC_00550]